MYTVKDIMATELQTLKPTDTLADARRLMSERHIRHLPVVDDHGRLVGLVTHRVALAAMDSVLSSADEETRRKHESAIPVSEFMTTQLDTVDEHASLRSAARYIERHKHGCLPVVSRGKLRGIVTDTDFVAVAINLLEQLEESEPPEAG